MECQVTGRVQMVMYRDFACRHARKLGLHGMVRNNDDGSVTLVAEGDEQVLMKYLRSLNQGPVLAHVEHVEVIWEDARGDFSKFMIMYT